MWVELASYLGSPSCSFLPLWPPSPHITVLFCWVLPAPLLNGEHLAGRGWTSATFLSPHVSCNAWHRAGTRFRIVGKHGIICVYQDQEKNSNSAFEIHPQPLPWNTFSVFLPTNSYHKSSTLDVFCTFHCPYSCSVCLPFSSESCPSKSCSLFRACLKLHSSLPLSYADFSDRRNLPCSFPVSPPMWLLLSTTFAPRYMLHPDLPTGLGIEISPCDTV